MLYYFIHRISIYSELKMISNISGENQPNEGYLIFQTIKINDS